MQSILQITLGGEPIKTSHYNIKRRAVQSPASHPGVHVRGGGECVSGAAAGLPQDS